MKITTEKKNLLLLKKYLKKPVVIVKMFSVESNVQLEALVAGDKELKTSQRTPEYHMTMY